GIGVPIESAVSLNLVGRVPLLVEIFAVLRLHRGRIARAVGEGNSFGSDQHGRCGHQKTDTQELGLGCRMSCLPGTWASPRAWNEAVSSLRQREHGECSAERGVVAQRGVTTHGTETLRRLSQAGRETDACPAADTGQHGDILLAVMLVGRARA